MIQKREYALASNNMTSLIPSKTSNRTNRTSLFPSLNVLDYGAAADGVRDDTDAFERAIQELEDHGGGRLLVPGGGAIYNIRPINLTSHMELYVQAGATIRGIADEAVWPLIPGTYVLDRVYICIMVSEEDSIAALTDSFLSHYIQELQVTEVVLTMLARVTPVSCTAST